ncbi:hypothetical protein PG995_002752 [Apiospora arundinis]
MEALGAAGSIVGILGFIGQSVDGIAKLQRFFADYKKAPHLTQKLRSDMTSLEATLKDVKAVVQHLESQPSYSQGGDIAETIQLSIANLRYLAHMCSYDIESWIDITAGLDPKRKSGFKAFFRQIKMAMSGPDTLRSFEADVMKHRQNISNSLAALTVNLVLKGHMSIGELSSKMDLFSDTQRKASEAILDQLNQAEATTDDSMKEPVTTLLLDVHAILQDRFNALSEARSPDRGLCDQEIRSLYASSHASAPYMTPVSGSPIHRSSPHRLKWPPEHRRPSSNAGSFDMASICSSLSSIAASLSALPPRQYSPAQSELPHIQRSFKPLAKQRSADDDDAATPTTEWTCDALSGTDDARIPSEEDPQLELCLLCGKGFMMKTLDDPHLFGKHLVYEHSFGKCDLNESFGSWEELKDHLEQFHRAGSLDATDSTYTGRLGLQRFKRRISVSSSSEHPYFSDAAGASTDLEMYEQYAKETDLRLQTELLELLVKAGILESRDLANPSFRPDLTCAINTLNVMCRSPPPPFPLILPAVAATPVVERTSYD